MKKSNQYGFTLLEVLVALAILASGIIVLNSAWSGNTLRIRKANLYQNVSTLLERKMVELESKYKAKPFNEIPEEEEGDFGEDFPLYRWQMKTRDMEMPDLSGALTPPGESLDDNLRTMIKTMTESISKSVKELKVSVFVKHKGAKDVEFSVTTYLVNWGFDLGLGSGGGAGGASGGGTGSSGTGGSGTGGSGGSSR